MGGSIKLGDNIGGDTPELPAVDLDATDETSVIPADGADSNPFGIPEGVTEIPQEVIDRASEIEFNPGLDFDEQSPEYAAWRDAVFKNTGM